MQANLYATLDSKYLEMQDVDHGSYSIWTLICIITNKVSNVEPFRHLCEAYSSHNSFHALRIKSMVFRRLADGSTGTITS